MPKAAVASIGAFGTTKTLKVNTTFKPKTSQSKFSVDETDFCITINRIFEMTLELFKSLVKQIMLRENADEEFINEVLTDSEVLYALNNNLSPEELAWGLMF